MYFRTPLIQTLSSPLRTHTVPETTVQCSNFGVGVVEETTFDEDILQYV